MTSYIQGSNGKDCVTQQAPTVEACGSGRFSQPSVVFGSVQQRAGSL